jgi:catechol 2,3-dioxygenase
MASDMSPAEVWRPAEKPPRRIRALGYADLEVTDLTRSRDFYTRVANLVVTEEDRQTVYLRCQSDHHSVLLRQAPAARLRCMAFETGDDADTEALRDRLQQRGVAVREAEPVSGCLGLAFEFQDPDGNGFRVYRAQSRRAPIVSDGPYPVLKLGHFTLRTPRTVDLARFHRETVGFRISDFRAGGGVFMRCGREHHNLAYVHGETPLFHHMAFDLGNWEGTKRCLDWLARQQWAVEDGPTRHGPGNNVAVYFGDPDGFHLEMYSEMETFDGDDEDHFRSDYQALRNLWTRRGVFSRLYNDMVPRDEHGRYRDAPWG